MKYTSTLFNKNTPQIIINVLENHVKNKIINQLDINFSKEELRTEILKKLKQDMTLGGKMFNVKKAKEYTSNTCINYQISKQYGEGKIILIPNIKDIGVGKSKRYCSIEEFKQNNLDLNDIDIEDLISHFNPLIEISKYDVFDGSNKSKEIIK
jgi:hypothetical protein